MSAMPLSVPTAHPGPEGRRIARTSILVAATLRVGGQALAVRIRNMSINGALIEGVVLASPHVRVELVRGDLSTSGVVSWVDGNRCGVKLDDPISVEHWISGKASIHQTRVDGMIVEARRAIASVPSGQIAPDELHSGIGRPGVAAVDEIASIIAALAVLGDRLSDDPEVVERHLVQLQALDETQQRLAALKQRLA